MFELDRFISDCRAAQAQDPTHKAVQELVTRAVRAPAAILAALGEPSRGGVRPLYHAPDLTILNVVWPPNMTVMPHDHRMWAVIGVYSGREDNIFWRRRPEASDGRVEARGAMALSAGEVTPLGKDIIHSVNNPLSRLTAAIHVYGGDFFAAQRSEWDAESLTEQPFDVTKAQRLFEAANQRAQALAAA